ncbi:MAG: extradiol dioxygenase [Candidatus Sulfotelmatobacter sp.]|jgi:catechol 2,3-dioxygenase-like lactoylglutathione lyase family enzyme
MIMGTHILFYSGKPEADRAFLRDVLGFKSVDAGGGWLIFAFPPAEAAVHPIDGGTREQTQGVMLEADIYLMCDDLEAEMKKLKAKKVTCSPVETARWGMKTSLRLPSGGELGLYQPMHPVAIDMKS